MKGWLVAGAFLCFWAGVADARPGGGHTYSSGSSSHSSSSSSHSSGSSTPHSSGSSSSNSGSSSSDFGSPSTNSGSSYTGGNPTYYSSSGGGSDNLDLLFFLFSSPRGWMSTVVIVLIVLYLMRRRKPRVSWSTARNSPPPPVEPPERRLGKLRAVDPGFSTVVFQDFLYSLYAEAQAARAGKLERLSPYLSTDARANLAAVSATPPAEVSEIVVGAMTIDDVVLGVAATAVTVTFTASYSERNGKTVHWAVVETWRLGRPSNVKSRPPARARTLDCPNCAAALTEVENGVCSHCGKNVGTGAFDWQVASVEIGSREDGGVQLDSGGYAEERTPAATILASDRDRELGLLKQRDPAFTEAQLLARVSVVFTEMQVGWSTRDWKRVRPFLSDSLFQSQLYWIQTYIRRRQKNVTENNNLTNTLIVKVSSDPWFDSVTVRIWAVGLDYTITDDGKLVGGSRTKRRAYSEYWTFIRGHDRAKPAGDAAKESSNTKCPNCGADLEINMAGSCEYCQAKVTSGEFDWVLSKIEQDEVYAG